MDGERDDVRLGDRLPLGNRQGRVSIGEFSEASRQELLPRHGAKRFKQALIVDDRKNGGGQAANYVTELLSRPYLASWKDRDGLVFDTPGGAIYGPKAMLIDQDAGSGGDFMPYAFKRVGLGPLIGKRTWGGVVGISGHGSLIDGGQTYVPQYGNMSKLGQHAIEGVGVSPDIEVDNDPASEIAGKDNQLDRAIAEVMKALAKDPHDLPKRPADPVKTKAPLR